MDKKLETAMNDLKQAEQKINEPKGNVTPKVMAEAKKPPVEIPPKAKLSEKQKKLREFVKQTNSIYAQNAGTPYEKWYATQQAWSYLAALNNCHVEIIRIWRDEDPLDKNAVIVFAEGILVDDTKEQSNDEKPITRGVMCASTSEEWLKGKPLSAVYGLAQTRLEERLVKMKFGYQLSLAHLEPTGAEELDLDVEKYGTKDKEV